MTWTALAKVGLLALGMRADEVKSQFISSGAKDTTESRTTSPGDEPSRAALRWKAESGDAEAQSRLALMLAQGDGGKKDETEALAWAQTAAENGWPEALATLGGVPALEPLLARQTQRLGAEHPDTLKTLRLLGRMHLANRDLERAAARLAQAVEGQRRILGPDHPNTLHAMNDLGVVQSQRGQHERAVAIRGSGVAVAGNPEVAPPSRAEGDSPLKESAARTAVADFLDRSALWQHQVWKERDILTWRSVSTASATRVPTHESHSPPVGTVAC